MRRTARLTAKALRSILLGLSWPVVAALVVVSGFHLVHREPWTLILDLIAVTPWIYMLAWATASMGLFFRRRVLTAVSAMLVLLQLWWVIPDFDPISHLARPGPNFVSLRLFDANVSQANRNLYEIADEIRQDKAQIVTMEELTPVSYRSLLSTHVMQHYRYRIVRPTAGAYGMALWSVFPLADATEWYALSSPLRTPLVGTQLVRLAFPGAVSSRTAGCRRCSRTGMAHDVASRPAAGGPLLADRPRAAV